MPSFRGHVEYAVDLQGWEPAGVDLVDFTQDNPMLDAHRQVLAAEFPRRKFETELRITVGGLRASTGTYCTGRDRSSGLAKLADLQRAHKLGIVNGWHLITKTFDTDDHSRSEGTAVWVEARFNFGSSSVFVHATGPFGDRHLDTLVDAAWPTFLRLIEAAPVAEAYATWDDQLDEYTNPPPGEPPVAAFMLLDGPLVAKLGGADTAAKLVGAFDWKAVRNDEANRVVMKLGRRPEDTSSERLAQIRTQLRGL